VKQSIRTPLFLLRLAMGWLFFYAGITKVLDASWSAAGYLNSAETFGIFYAWLASPELLPVTNFVNQFGLTLLGVFLLLGLFVRWSAYAGAVLMLLYYFPVLTFPYIGTHAFLVDEHIIYALSLIMLGILEAGRTWGLDGKIKLF
jgi:thiosulfate dehydrogenase (quinone) large subunit